MAEAKVQEVDHDELADVVLETLEGIMETMTAPEIPLFAGPANMVIEAKVPVLGDDSGMFTVRVAAPAAMSLAAMWLNLEPPEVTIEDACDAVSEFCNMLAGSAKTLVSAETALDIPRVQPVYGDELHPLPQGVEVFHDLGVFIVEFSG
ncbi:MAG: chemotaxis protein CheX [Actinomycetia bacterium]|nr:chemotaxis protein CheX [Actinomycetes bacterium]MCP4959064.1 chemotaxis protein CheX [Actinomycetes bacterium]